MQKINRFINHLSKYQALDSVKVDGWSAKRAVYMEPGKYTYENEESDNVHIGDHLIHSGTTIFLTKTIEIPENWVENTIGLDFLVGQAGVKTNHEGLVSIDGKPYHGIDRNRSLVVLPTVENGKRTFDIHIELFNPTAQPLDKLNYQNEPAEHSPAPLNLLNSELVFINDAVQNLLYTIKSYYEAARLLQSDDLRRAKIIEILYSVEEMTVLQNPERLVDQAWVQSIEEQLLEELKNIKTEVNGKIHMVGQSHIDLAWLWPYKETVRKCSRTFSTMSALLDQFPNFKFAQSQPQAYELVKENYPDLYERIKQYISDGRWEIVGGMWVEPDLNIPSGESLVRQLLYGMKFYEEEFGVQPKIEWLPDTFGYCASLPQILKKSGIEYFMTTKMNWNDTNEFPYDLFNWVGIDGTSIVSYLNHGVNEYTHPKEIKDHWDSYRQKAIHPEQMLLYGHGDGGGGVTREMLQYIEKSNELPGLPKIEYSTAHEFFETINDKHRSLPTWVGDMYLELHRGTYTTHAKNKRWNRKAEVLYRDAEIWMSFASLVGEEMKESLEEGWKLILLNQFHDIIPGTSIPEVYVKSEEDYETIFTIGENVKDKSIHVLKSKIDTSGEGIPVVVFNSLSWERSEVVKIKGGPELNGLIAHDQKGEVLPTDQKVLDDQQIELSVYISNIPEMGYKTIWLKQSIEQNNNELDVFNGKWETSYYIVEWNENGEMVRLYDKEQNREVLTGMPANQFQLFHDKPMLWDAWDIDEDFEDHIADFVKLKSVNITHQGKTKDVLQFKWSISNSTIKQNIIFYHHSKRIDFETKVDWNEDHKLLKVAFPVDILANKATYEIPFGALDRPTHNNTTWEQAQFEVCGHKFADLSEGNYGVSLLNDCKYGYDIKGNVIRLSLLRAPKWPDPTADLGEHTFTYSLYPHEGNWVEAKVTRIGYELNYPVTTVITDAHEGELSSEYSFVKVESDHIILDTVKHAEIDDHMIFRFYESSGSRDVINVQFNQPVQSTEETNLLEKPIQTLQAENNLLTIDHKPYEVKTIRLKL